MSPFGIFEKFPPPDFLDVPRFSIVFSDFSVKGLMFDKHDKRSVSHREVLLETGVIESGVIKNQDKLKKALVELKKNFSNTHFAAVAIPDQLSYVFTVEVPVTPGKSAQEAVAFVLEENAPLSLSEAAFDFTPQKIKNTGDSCNATVVATAASSASVQSYIEILKSVEVEPILCLNESQAIAKAVVPRNFQEISIISYIHTTSVGTYVARGQVVEFSSIAKVQDKSKLVQVVVSEISNAIKYCAEHEKDEANPIQCMVCGNHDMCLTALNEIKTFNSLNPSLANIWVNVFDLDKYIPDISFENSLRFASAVGLLI